MSAPVADPIPSYKIFTWGTGIYQEITHPAWKTCNRRLGTFSLQSMCRRIDLCTTETNFFKEFGMRNRMGRGMDITYLNHLTGLHDLGSSYRTSKGSPATPGLTPTCKYKCRHSKAETNRMHTSEYYHIAVQSYQQKRDIWNLDKNFPSYLHT